ncbi:MAG: hypothetical protein ACOCUK_01910 [bacterium]
MASEKQQWISEKIKTLREEGYKQDQAVAIAHSMWNQRQQKGTS